VEDLSSINNNVILCGEGNSPESKPTITTTRLYDADIASRIPASLIDCHYDKVTEYIGDFFAPNIGKNVYYFLHNKHQYSRTGPNAAYYGFYEYKGWGNDVLVKKETYKKNEDNPVTIDTYDYTYQYDEQHYKNSLITKLTDYPDIYFTNPPPDPSDMDVRTWEFFMNNPPYQASAGLLTDVYAYLNYDIVTGSVKLASETHFETTPNGVVYTTTGYEYSGAQPYFPSKITTTKSDGTFSVVEKTYPYDYGSTEPYLTMTTLKNMIAPTIQQKLSIQNGGTTTLLKATKTNYYGWGNNIIQPITVQEATGTNALSNLETRIQFDSYDDKGNVTAAAKSNDVQKVFLWGYNKSYLVAEITGAPLNIIQSVPSLNMTVIENATGSYNDAQVRTELDKIRSYLNTNYPVAQLITCTYNPLIGMTSQTDVNGRTTYYEYDAIGRLQLIKDKDGNVVKTFTYKYKQ
jgi:YD repeat-containing protein